MQTNKHNNRNNKGRHRFFKPVFITIVGLVLFVSGIAVSHMADEDAEKNLHDDDTADTGIMRSLHGGL